ncbi:MAG: hypothetical protein KAV82_09215 [Phycisphaerae bacterium]|nr:hypothetical protein [Phycisphaerae bacterium]
MGKGADLVKAARAIQQALTEFVREGEKGNVHVFESLPGNLRAVVGSDQFKNMGITERQDMIWDYMEKTVAADHLRFCWGIHPMDLEEYYEEHFPQSPSPSSYPSVEE